MLPEQKASIRTAQPLLHYMLSPIATQLVSGFKANGKAKPIKVMQKNPKFQRILWWTWRKMVFTRRGYFWSESIHMCNIQESCQKCQWIEIHPYQRPVWSKTGKLSNLQNIDFCSFPSCGRFLIHHMYQMVQTDLSLTHPVLLMSGIGWTHVDGEILPLWYEGNCLPSSHVGGSNILTDKEI